MATLVFDIETLAFQNTSDEAALSPATAKLALLTLFDLERELSTIYIIGEGGPVPMTDEKWLCKSGSEKQVLKEFWEGITMYDTYVGFGSRRFDAPFLIHRSLACGVAPSNRLRNYKELTRQSLPFHVDLFDEFSFYGAMSKPLSLSALGTLYKVTGVDELQPYERLLSVMKEENTVALLKHAKAKITVTKELYLHWRQHLAPPHFLNTIDL